MPSGSWQPDSKAVLQEGRSAMAKMDELMQQKLGLRERPVIVGDLVALSSPYGDNTGEAQAVATFALPCQAKSMHSTYGTARKAQTQQETKDLTQKVQMCPIQHECKSWRNPPHRYLGWEILSCWDQNVSVPSYVVSSRLHSL